MLGMIAGILFGLYAAAAVINAAGVIIGAALSGAASLAGGIVSGAVSLTQGVFSAEGVPLGIALGLVWYFLRRRNAAALNGERAE